MTTKKNRSLDMLFRGILFTVFRWDFWFALNQIAIAALVTCDSIITQSLELHTFRSAFGAKFSPFLIYSFQTCVKLNQFHLQLSCNPHNESASYCIAWLKSDDAKFQAQSTKLKQHRHAVSKTIFVQFQGSVRLALLPRSWAILAPNVDFSLQTWGNVGSSCGLVFSRS